MFPGLNNASRNEIANTVRKWFARYGFDYDRFSEQRWSLHRAHPDVTIDQYRCRLLHRFGQLVSDKTIVYLDLKYWINLRKVLLGQEVERGYVELYSLLTKAVESGTVVCPLSFWIFQELLKQTDFESRKTTARLIDLLSDGVAFAPHDEIVAQEVLHFIRKFNPHYAGSKQWPIGECIWTRTISFLGDQIPTWPETGIPETDQLQAQKHLEDFHCFIPLEYLITTIEVVPTKLMYKGYDVEDINRRKHQVRLEHRSFKSIFLAELMHTIKENEDHWYEAMAYLYFLESGIQETIPANARTEVEKMTSRNVIWLHFKKNKITNELPSYHIPAGLYAAVCWDINRQLSKNDLFDFHHAQIAIPYCDVFLTETPLKSLACSGNLGFDTIYNTAIIAEPGEAVAYFQQKLQKECVSRARVVRELFNGDTYARST